MENQNDNKEINEEAAEATPNVEDAKPMVWGESKWDDGSVMS